MLRAGWDYRVFERQPGPGHFFKHLPRHRQLISLNKRHTGRSNVEFSALCHQLNSLPPQAVAAVGRDSALCREAQC